MCYGILYSTMRNLLNNGDLLEFIYTHNQLCIIINLSKYFYNTGCLWLLTCNQLSKLIITLELQKDTSCGDERRLREQTTIQLDQVLRGCEVKLSRKQPIIIIERHRAEGASIEDSHRAHDRLYFWLQDRRMNGRYEARYHKEEYR